MTAVFAAAAAPLGWSLVRRMWFHGPIVPKPGTERGSSEAAIADAKPMGTVPLWRQWLIIAQCVLVSPIIVVAVAIAFCWLLIRRVWPGRQVGGGAGSAGWGRAAEWGGNPSRLDPPWAVVAWGLKAVSRCGVSLDHTNSHTAV